MILIQKHTQTFYITWGSDVSFSESHHLYLSCVFNLSSGFWIRLLYIYTVKEHTYCTHTHAHAHTQKHSGLSRCDRCAEAAETKGRFTTQTQTKSLDCFRNMTINMTMMMVKDDLWNVYLSVTSCFCPSAGVWPRKWSQRPSAVINCVVTCGSGERVKEVHRVGL